MIPKLWDGKYCGQKQKWVLIIFEGNDNEINLNTEHPEFEEWQWIEISKLSKIVIPFKKKLYNVILEEFEDIIRQP